MAFLFADIGGTNVRFGYSKTKHSNIICEVIYKVSDYKSIEAAIENYCIRYKVSPKVFSFCVAAPTSDNAIVFTNNHWQFKKDSLQKTFGLKEILCINDFTAQALSQIPFFLKGLNQELLNQSDLLKIFYKGRPDTASSIFVIGPGTGLGASTLVSVGNSFKALQAEGGHTHFCPTSTVELELLAWLQNRFGHVSSEQVISGAGLENIYQFLNTRFTSLGKVDLKASEIGSLALKGDPLCLQAVNIMMGALGTATANGVLTTGSFRGVVICGGIIPKLSKLFFESPFYEKFTYNKPKYSTLLKSVPIYISEDPYSGLKGCQQAIHNKFLQSEVNRFFYD